MITFNNNKYLRAWGVAPIGNGQWAFQFGEYGRTLFWFGTLTEAKKAAKQKARKEGYDGVIFVLP